MNLDPDRPGRMSAAFWSRCRACVLPDPVIHGPGTDDAPCPCGTKHWTGDTQVLTDLPDGGRAWLHEACAAALDPSPTDTEGPTA